MQTVDARLIVAWLAARSLSRDLPAPVPDRGGWRVDTGHPAERCRHIFTAPCAGLSELGAAIDEPHVMLKLPATHEELAALLPPRWRMEPLAYVMTCPDGFGDSGRAELPRGYRMSL